MSVKPKLPIKPRLISLEIILIGHQFFSRKNKMSLVSSSGNGAVWNLTSRYSSKTPEIKVWEQVVTYSVRKELLVINIPPSDSDDEQNDGTENIDVTQNPQIDNADNTINDPNDTQKLNNQRSKFFSTSNKNFLTAIIASVLLFIVLLTGSIWIFKSPEDVSNLRKYLEMEEMHKVNQYNIRIMINVKNTTYYGFVDIIFDISHEVDHVILSNVATIINSVYIFKRNATNLDYKEYANATYTNFIEDERLLVRFDNKLIIGEYKLTINYENKMVSNISTRGLYIQKLPPRPKPLPTYQPVFSTDYINRLRDSYVIFTNIDYYHKHYIIPCFNNHIAQSMFNLTLQYPKNMRIHQIGESAYPGPEPDWHYIRKNGYWIFLNLWTFTLRPQKMPLGSFGFAITDMPAYRKIIDWTILTTDKLIDQEIMPSFCTSILIDLSRYVYHPLELYSDSTYIAVRSVYLIMLPIKPTTRHFRNIIIYSEDICENMVEESIEFVKQLLEMLASTLLDRWFGHTFSSVDHTKNEIRFMKGLKLYFQTHIINVYNVDRSNETNHLDIFNSFRTDIYRKNFTPIGDVDYDAVKTSVILFMMQNSYGNAHFKQVVLDVLTNETNQMRPIEEKLHYFKTEIDSERQEKLGNWLYLIGFPIINVTIDYDLINFTSEVITDFYEINKFNSSTRVSVNVTTPITFTTSHELKFDVLAPVLYIDNDEPTQFVIDDRDEPVTWIIANIQQSGYYRVNYEESIWREIISYLTANEKNYKTIHVINRAKLIDDAAHLADAGYLEYNILFDLMSYLRHETELLPLLTARNAIKYLEHKLMDAKPLYDKLQEMMKELLATYYTEHAKNIRIIPWGVFLKYSTYMFWNNLSAMSETEFAIDYGCQLNISDCVETAITTFHDWMKKAELLELNGKRMKSFVCTAIRHGNGTEFDFMMEYFWTVPDNYTKNVLEMLGCTQSTENMQKYLKLTLEQTQPTKNFLEIGINSVLSNVKGLEVLLRFLFVNYAAIGKLHKVKTINTDDIVLTIIDKVNSDTHETWFLQFLPLIPLRNDTKEKIQHIIAYNKHWMSRNYKMLEKRLTAKR